MTFSLALSRFVLVVAGQGGSCRLSSQTLTGRQAKSVNFHPF